VTVANLGDCTADFQVTSGPAGFAPSTGSGTVAGHSQTTVTVGDGCAPDVAVKWTATVTWTVEEGGSGPDANPENDSATAFPCGESPPGDF